MATEIQMNARSVVMTVAAAVSATMAVAASVSVAVTAIVAGLAAVGGRAPAVNRLSAVVIAHHHSLAVNFAPAGIALAGGGTVGIIMASLGSGGSQDRKAQSERKDREQFFHRIGFSLDFEFGYTSRSHKF